MVPFVLASLMEGPVLIEVTTGSKGAQSQNSLGTVHAPTSTGYSHAVFYRVPKGTFDNSCGDGQSFSKVAIISEIGVLPPVNDGPTFRRKTDPP